LGRLTHYAFDAVL
ncbi:unnamed protein product, partial [Diplocarpon coronariae]